jgi:light-regulated signal transduction histidine kinase (bacteriophytochrome)
MPAPSREEVRCAIDEDLPEAIGFIRSSTQKMDRLINAILRLSREGRRTLAPERIELGALVRGIGETMQHRLTETGTTLTIESLPVMVSDRMALEQILQPHGKRAQVPDARTARPDHRARGGPAGPRDHRGDRQRARHCCQGS